MALGIAFAGAQTRPVAGFDDIVYWVGAGKNATNRAALVIQWNVPGSGGSTISRSVVWGYGWNSGSPTGYDMLAAVDAMDERLNVVEASTNNYAAFGMFYDADGDGGGFGAGTPGIYGLTSDEPGYVTDADDLYQSGWADSGFWEYSVYGGRFDYDVYDDATWEFLGSGTYDTAGSSYYPAGAWFSSPIGSKARLLVNGAWDAYSFTPDYTSRAVMQPCAATLPVPRTSLAKVVGGRPTVRVHGHQGRKYQLQWKADLGPGAWNNLGAERDAVDGLMEFADDSASQPASRYYRVLVR